MDAFPPAAASVAEVHRSEFNSAYSTLEQTIRNFSKEKLFFEQTIEGLQNQLAVAQDSMQKLALENQNVDAENMRLERVHQENELLRAELEAVTLSVERKLEIILETLSRYEQVEQNVVEHYEEHEQFVCNLKFRQVQLKNWIDQAAVKNGALHHALDEQTEEFRSATENFNKEKTTMKASFETARAKLTEEKEEMTKNHQAAIDEMVRAIEGLQVELVNVKSKMEEEVSGLQEEKKALLDKLEEMEASKTNQALEFEAEKKVMTAAFNQERSQLQAEKELVDQKHTAFIQEMDLITEQLKSEMNELRIKLADEVAGLQGEKKALQDDLEELKMNIENQALTSEEEKKTMTASFEEERIKFEAEKELMDKNHKAAQDDLLLSIEKLQTEFNEYQTKMTADEATLQGEKATLLEKLEEAGTNMEKQAVAFQEEKKIMTANFEEQCAKLQAEKELMDKNHQTDIDELRLSKETVEKEMNNVQAKMEEEVSALQGEKTALSEALEETKASMIQQASSFDEEKTAMKVTFEEEYTKFDAEKEKLKKNHKEALDDLQEELDRSKSEKRELQKRYQDQKQAIAKMVEEVGVRPVVLPSGRSSTRDKMPPPATPKSSQDRNSESLRQPPRTPTFSRVPSNPSTPSRTGILKRHSFSAGDKAKNVTFGPTSSVNFEIPSDTDDSSEADVSKKEASRKRVKLTEEDKDDDAATEDVEDENEKPEKREGKVNKPRRYLKRGISHKRSSVSDNHTSLRYDKTSA